jgi:L-lactate utilization protein LutB
MSPAFEKLAIYSAQDNCTVWPSSADSCCWKIPLEQIINTLREQPAKAGDKHLGRPEQTHKFRLDG